MLILAKERSFECEKNETEWRMQLPWKEKWLIQVVVNTDDQVVIGDAVDRRPRKLPINQNSLQHTFPPNVNFKKSLTKKHTHKEREKKKDGPVVWRREDKCRRRWFSKWSICRGCRHWRQEAALGRRWGRSLSWWWCVETVSVSSRIFLFWEYAGKSSYSFSPFVSWRWDWEEKKMHRRRRGRTYIYQPELLCNTWVGRLPSPP